MTADHGDMRPPRPAPPAPGRLTPAVVAILAVCLGVEAVLVAADLGLIGDAEWRGLAYRAGAFWPGLLADWRPTFALQPMTMFVTHAFLHAGLAHLAGNMVTLLVLAEYVVARVGQAGFLVIYGLATLGGGAMFAALASAAQPMVGASGALFGLAAAWQYWGFADAPPGPRRRRQLAQGIFGLVVLNVVLWVLLDGAVAWQAHLGGYLAGGAAAAVLGRRGRWRPAQG